MRRDARKLRSIQRGDEIGFLTVVNIMESTPGRYSALCRCICGNEITIQLSYLECGSYTSCGCMRGKVNTRFYKDHDCGSCADKRECPKIFCKYERELKK